MSDIYTKEESIGCLTACHREDEFFCTIWDIKCSNSPMVVYFIQRAFQRHFTRPNQSSNEESYVINKLEKKTSPLADFVTTKPMTNLCLEKTRSYRDKTKFYRDKARFCRDKAFLRQNPYFVATELATNPVATNPYFVAMELAKNSAVTKPNFVMTKPNFVVTKPMTKLSCDKTQIFSQQS